MDLKEAGRILYRDGYRLAATHLEGGMSAAGLKEAIRSMYGAVDGLLEAFLKRSAGEGNPAECRKGCAWCCHQAVFAVTHELLYLHDHVAGSFGQDQRDAFVRQAREKSTQTLNRPLEEQIRVRSPCPFLDEGSCAVYPARPMACRIYLSSSAASCEKEYSKPGNSKNIPGLYEFPLRAGRMLNEGFVAYMKQNGKPSVELPLEQGYASVDTLGQTFTSWIGEE